MELSGVPNGRPMQAGIVLYARAPGHVEASICNFSGGPMDPIVDLPVRVITIN